MSDKVLRVNSGTLAPGDWLITNEMLNSTYGREDIRQLIDFKIITNQQSNSSSNQSMATGGLIGYAIGGPIGALAGAALGGNRIKIDKLSVAGAFRNGAYFSGECTSEVAALLSAVVSSNAIHSINNLDDRLDSQAVNPELDAIAAARLRHNLTRRERVNFESVALMISYIHKMTVLEIALKTEISERRIRAAFTRWGLQCEDFDGKAAEEWGLAAIEDEKKRKDNERKSSANIQTLSISGMAREERVEDKIERVKKSGKGGLLLLIGLPFIIVAGMMIFKKSDLKLPQQSLPPPGSSSSYSGILPSVLPCKIHWSIGKFSPELMPGDKVYDYSVDGRIILRFSLPEEMALRFDRSKPEKTTGRSREMDEFLIKHWKAIEGLCT
jgi:hypothetical protein